VKLVIVLPSIVGILSVGLPWLILRTMRGREAAAFDAVQTVLSAQRRYSIKHGGRYVEIECLAALQPGCGERYIDPALVPSALAPEGYERYFEGLPAPADGKAAANELRGFVYRADPVPGLAVRYYCGDETGRVCANRGRRVEVVAGHCALQCDEELPAVSMKP